MPVIDADSHFEPGPAWLDTAPDLRERLPDFDTAEVTTKIVAGDILANVPRDEWPAWEELLPPGILAIAGKAEKPDDYGYEGSSMHGATDPASRVAWLDDNGIDLENVICLEGMINARFLDDRALARDVITACNSWLADAVDGYTDRLLPVTCLDFSDVGAAVREMARMRERGSRAFLIGTIPVPGVPVMHPRFEPIWSAATDLGMIALLHVGYQPASFDPAWANTAGDMMLLRQLGVSQGHQSVELMLNGLIFGGTFHRHPALTVLIAECGLYWFAGALDHMDSRDARVQPEARLYMGEYPFDLSPSEFARRNVRITPLPRRHQSPVALLEQYPECVVFSSDFNHNEGSGTPTGYYRDLLAGVDEPVVAGFMGSNLAACYERMGDPLPGLPTRRG
ncbi:MAG TPA: amidohydrolase family protein [Acidimicrobiia bacterium]|nr:amidohydrolase family protein [Acidimicrobiia bacterium]